MSKHDNFQKQIYKYLNDVPTCAINTNEILLRLIATELATIVDSIGTLANINYDLAVKNEEEGNANEMSVENNER